MVRARYEPPYRFCDRRQWGQRKCLVRYQYSIVERKQPQSADQSAGTRWQTIPRECYHASAPPPKKKVTTPMLAITWGNRLWESIRTDARPVSAISRVMCLMAQMTLSIMSLNLAGSNANKATEIQYSQNRQVCQWRYQSLILFQKVNIPLKQLLLIALKSLKKPTRCSGNSEKSWLIIVNVGSKTSSSIAATLPVNSG